MKKLLALIFVFLFVLGCHQSKVKPIPFDTTTWQTGITDRSAMLRDLTGNHLATTMTRDDVKRILGEPDRIVAKKELPRLKNNVEEYWQYDMELDDECFDCHVFRVGFDEHGNYCHWHVFKN